MEGALIKMEQMEKHLMSKMEETRGVLNNMEKHLMLKMEETQSVVIDELKQIDEKIEQVPGKSDYDPNPFTTYKKCGFIGGGGYGEVFLVRDERNNEGFAMKCVFLDDNNLSRDLAREISLLYDLEHANIIKLIKVFPYRSHMYLLMEDAGVDLHNYLKMAGKKVSARVIKDWLRQLLSALDYLHERGIIHRDLKTENICIKDHVKLRICDFGTARRPGDVRLLTPRPATLLFMAPEMLMGDDKYGAKVDMWSAGCVFYEMVVQKNPFDIPRGHGGSPMSVLHEIFRKIGKPKEGSMLFSLRDYPDDEKEYRGHQEYQEASDVVPIPGHVPGLDAEGNDLLKKLLAVDPGDRITAREALNHPYFKVDTGAADDDETAEMMPKPKRSKFHSHASDFNSGL